MKGFGVRFLSAVVALAVLWGLYHFWGNKGLVFLGYLTVPLICLEGFELLFTEKNNFEKILFITINLVVFVLTVYTYSELSFAFGGLLLCVISLLKHKKYQNLSHLVDYQSRSLLGLFYLGLLPGLAIKILFLPQGFEWFVTLLAVVFSGDSMAYVTGVLWGKTKIMPQLSPKKSVQGSLGGLVGSLLAGWLCQHFLFPDSTLIFFLGLSLMISLLAQIGDFFESLLKRVANIKDSGSIMPGHGGILDRIDGVLFAAPVIHLGMRLLAA